MNRIFKTSKQILNFFHTTSLSTLSVKHFNSQAVASPSRLPKITKVRNSSSQINLADFKVDESNPNPYLNYITTRLGSKSKKAIEFEDKHNCLNYAPLPMVAEKGDGVYLHDIEGNKYFDCLSAYSAVNQGHNNITITQGLIGQASRLYMNSNAVNSHDSTNDALSLISSIFGYDRAFLMVGGVDGGETSIKLARRWAYKVKGVPAGEARILFANGNFWGRTLTACASSDDFSRYNQFGPFDKCNFDLIDFDDIDQLEDYFKKSPNCAAYMLEPIQGENGIKIPAFGYLSKVRELCSKYNVLMLVDEVQTGLGRAGHLAYVNSEMVKPDILMLGKSLSGGVYPVSAILADDHLMSLFEPGDHGSHFSCTPLAAAAVKAAVQTLLEGRMATNAAVRGAELGLYLKHLLGNNTIVKEIRGRGLMFALELEPEASVSASQLCLILYERGILCKPTKRNIIRLTPPLVVSAEQIFEIANIIVYTLKEVEELAPYERKNVTKYNLPVPNEESQLNFLKRKDAKVKTKKARKVINEDIKI